MQTRRCAYPLLMFPMSDLGLGILRVHLIFTRFHPWRNLSSTPTGTGISKYLQLMANENFIQIYKGPFMCYITQ